MKIFGREWEQIKSLQQKTKTYERIIFSDDDIEKHKKTDMEALKKYGVSKLYEMKFFGVIDRLKRSRII